MKISFWKIIGLLLLLLLSAFCLWVYFHIEFVDQKIPGDFQGAAARNPLLAAGRLAGHYGATAHYVPAYGKPPPSGATLVFAAPRYWLSPEQSNALLDWVEKEGGHLIVFPQHRKEQDKNEPEGDTARSKNDKEDAIQDPLLDSLGISVQYIAYQKDKKPGIGTEKSSGKAGADDAADTLRDILRRIGKPIAETREVELPDGTRLKATLDPQLRLESSIWEDDDDWRIADPAANVKSTKNAKNHRSDYGLSYALGKGRFTVLTGLDFIDNSAIGEADNAALFAYIASPAKGQDIWFVYGSNVPVLWRWFAHRAWTVLIAALLLLAAWLWMVSRRFGPLLPTLTSTRRSIVEHVAASARYLWRFKQGPALYQALCDDFRKQLYLRHPHWSQLPAPELNQQIALLARESRIPQLSGLTEHAIEHLLNASHPRDEKQFAANSHLLEVLRNKL